MKKKTAKKILSDLEVGYDSIADKFSLTRAFMWRDLGFIKNIVKPGDRVLDFGCGNGRMAGFLENNYQEFIGVDISQKLINIAKQKYNNEKTKFIKIDGRKTKLQIKDDYFDVVFAIAVFHHFPNREYAQKIVNELYRALKPGGKIIITVWNLWQKRYLKYHQKSNKNWIDAKIPFRSGEKIFSRYHHPFQMGELEEIFSDAGFRTTKTKKGWNLLYIGEKLKHK